MSEVESRLHNLEERVAWLEGGRPGRKPLPILVSEEGVCGVAPETDSEVCPYASLYRRNKGCKGVACRARSDSYYDEYRRAKQAGRKAKKGAR